MKALLDVFSTIAIWAVFVLVCFGLPALAITAVAFFASLGWQAALFIF